MKYLFSHLEGAAARSVQGLTITEANYDNAIANLEERFGRPQQIIAARMDELLKVHPVQTNGHHLFGSCMIKFEFMYAFSRRWGFPLSNMVVY